MKSKIKSITPNGSWDGQYGKMFKFSVEMEDGKKGEVNSKSEQLKQSVGEEVEYEFTDGQFPKIKFLQDKKPFKSSSPASFALSYAKDLVVADKVKIDQILQTADKLYNWLKERE